MNLSIFFKSEDNSCIRNVLCGGHIPCKGIDLACRYRGATCCHTLAKLVTIHLIHRRSYCSLFCRIEIEGQVICVFWHHQSALIYLRTNIAITANLGTTLIVFHTVFNLLIVALGSHVHNPLVRTGKVCCGVSRNRQSCSFGCAPVSHMVVALVEAAVIDEISLCRRLSYIGLFLQFCRIDDLNLYVADVNITASLRANVELDTAIIEVLTLFEEEGIMALLLRQFEGLDAIGTPAMPLLGVAVHGFSNHATVGKRIVRYAIYVSCLGVVVTDELYGIVLSTGGFYTNLSIGISVTFYRIKGCICCIRLVRQIPHSCISRGIVHSASIGSLRNVGRGNLGNLIDTLELCPIAVSIVVHNLNHAIRISTALLEYTNVIHIHVDIIHKLCFVGIPAELAGVHR